MCVSLSSKIKINFPSIGKFHLSLHSVVNQHSVPLMGQTEFIIDV